MIALRKTHEVLRSANFLYGENSPGYGINDIEWWDERGQTMPPEDWNNPEGRALAMRRAVLLEDGRIEAITLLMNASEDPVMFTLPAPNSDREVLIDSAQPDLEPTPIGDTYEVQAHAAVLIRRLADKDV